MTRSECLKKADECVNGNREQDYGTPENNFRMIAEMWTTYLHGIKRSSLEPKDVAAMMALMKVCRVGSGNAKNDNWIDLAGYAACGAELESITTNNISKI